MYLLMLDGRLSVCLSMPRARIPVLLPLLAAHVGGERKAWLASLRYRFAAAAVFSYPAGADRRQVERICDGEAAKRDREACSTRACLTVG